MNENIKNLWDAALEEFCKQNPYATIMLPEPLREKFAEMLIKECAKFLDENSGYDDSNNAWHPEPEELLEHFGVSE